MGCSSSSVSKTGPAIRDESIDDFYYLDDDDVLGKGNPEVRGIDGTGQDYNARYNPMRDWYWFDEDETAQYVTGETEFVPEDDQPYDNYYMRQMNDWRLAMHQMAQYQDSGNRSRGAYDTEEFDGLSRIFTEHRNKMPSLFGSADGTSAVVTEADQESYFYPLQQAGSQEEYEKLLADDGGWWFSDHGDLGTVNPFRSMLLDDIMTPLVDNLYKSQFAAAKEQGYEDKYAGLSDWGDENASTWGEDDKWWQDEQFKLGSSQPTEWSIMYADPEKDLPIAQTAAELESQLQAIGAYDDRSRVQRDYLSNKVMVRYWMDQIAKFGGAQDLAEHLLNNRDVQLRWASPRLATDDTIDSSFDHLMPWSNAGEGAMPSLTNDDVQYDDWWQEKFEGLGAEIEDHVAQVAQVVPPEDGGTGATGGWEVDTTDATWGGKTGGDDAGGGDDGGDLATLPDLSNTQLDGDITPDTDPDFFTGSHTSHWDDGGGDVSWGFGDFWDDDGGQEDAPAERDAPPERAPAEPFFGTTMADTSDYLEVTPELHASIWHYEHPGSASTAPAAAPAAVKTV